VMPAAGGGTPDNHVILKALGMPGKLLACMVSHKNNAGIHDCLFACYNTTSDQQQTAAQPYPTVLRLQLSCLMAHLLLRKRWAHTAPRAVPCS
jgi:hypothetical protein